MRPPANRVPLAPVRRELPLLTGGTPKPKVLVVVRRAEEHLALLPGEIQLMHPARADLLVHAGGDVDGRVGEGHDVDEEEVEEGNAQAEEGVGRRVGDERVRAAVKGVVARTRLLEEAPSDEGGVDEEDAVEAPVGREALGVANNSLKNRL